MLSPDKMQHVRSKSEVYAERLLKGVVSVAASKLCKTDLVFVQLGTKTNSVYYSENVGYSNKVFCRRIRRVSNNDFLLQQDGAPVYHSIQHCRLPAFQCASVH